MNWSILIPLLIVLVAVPVIPLVLLRYRPKGYHEEKFGTMWHFLDDIDREGS